MMLFVLTDGAFCTSLRRSVFKIVVLMFGCAACRAVPQLGLSCLLFDVPHAVPQHFGDSRFNCWACRTPWRTTSGMVDLIVGRAARRRGAPQDSESEA